MEYLTKLYESDMFGENESASRFIMYKINDTDAFYELSDMSFDELCELFDVFDESGYYVAPGALYHKYDFFILGTQFFAMVETAAYNV